MRQPASWTCGSWVGQRPFWWSCREKIRSTPSRAMTSSSTSLSSSSLSHKYSHLQLESLHSQTSSKPRISPPRAPCTDIRTPHSHAPLISSASPRRPASHSRLLSPQFRYCPPTYSYPTNSPPPSPTRFPRLWQHWTRRWGIVAAAAGAVATGLRVRSLVIAPKARDRISFREAWAASRFRRTGFGNSFPRLASLWTRPPVLSGGSSVPGIYRCASLNPAEMAASFSRNDLSLISVLTTETLMQNLRSELNFLFFFVSLVIIPPQFMCILDVITN